MRRFGALPIERARGWGIAVPDDRSQVIYVWFDALANYITALDYGVGGDGYRTWWEEADERLHVIGKGILRFHAVYWPAILLSARQSPPTTIFVHDYLTVQGLKLSKSLGTAIEPAGSSVAMAPMLCAGGSCATSPRRRRRRSR